MVNTIKKRIVVRTDESIRKSEEESIEILNKAIPKEAGMIETFFDQALGEILIFVEKPSLLVNTGEDFDSIDLVEKTGWKIRVEKLLKKCLPLEVSIKFSIIQQINEFIFTKKLERRFSDQNSMK